MNPSLRLLAAALLACLSCLLSSCSNSSAERLQVRRVVVANYVEPSLARVRVGLTVFGNKPAINEAVPGLESQLDQTVRTAVNEHFSEVIHLNRPPMPPARRMAWLSTSEIYGEFAKSLAAQHHADAAVLILPLPMAPYGVPQHLAAEGLSLYFASGVLLPYPGMQVLVLSGTTGRKFDPGLFLTERKVARMPWKDHFSEYNADEQQTLVDEALQAFTIRLNNAIDAQGFKRRGVPKLRPDTTPSLPDWRY